MREANIFTAESARREIDSCLRQQIKRTLFTKIVAL